MENISGRWILEGLTGTRFGSGFAVMNGTVNAPINRYGQVVNAQIENNTFINYVTKKFLFNNEF